MLEVKPLTVSLDMKEAVMETLLSHLEVRPGYLPLHVSRPGPVPDVAHLARHCLQSLRAETCLRLTSLL